jgi:signal transduction histidine kinase
MDLSWLPRGRGLTQPDFTARHRLVTAIATAHIPVLMVYALAVGRCFDTGLHDILPVAGLLVIAMLPGRRLVRSLAASLSLLASSAVLVHLSGGMMELHFHYFVAIAIVSLYQEWVVYTTSVAFVLLWHAVLGAVNPTWIYGRAGNPWAEFAVHAGFVCALAMAQLCFWHYQERARAGEEHYRRQLYEGQQSLVAQLDEAARVRADLVGTVSHEFRTPMTGISGSLLTLRRRRRQLDEHTVDELLDAAMHHADRLRRMLENMLTAAQATAVDTSAVEDIAAAARDVVAALPSPQRERLVLDLPESLHAYIGPGALHQVLANLVDNALDHSVAETPVHVSLGRVGDDAVLRVRNSGRDLDPATVSRLLEPFTQADGSLTRAREGAGLGLYVVRRLVEVHGGKLALTSADGQVTAEVDLRAALFGPCTADAAVAIEVGGAVEAGVAAPRDPEGDERPSADQDSSPVA